VRPAPRDENCRPPVTPPVPPPEPRDVPLPAPRDVPLLLLRAAPDDVPLRPLDLGLPVPEVR